MKEFLKERKINCNNLSQFFLGLKGYGKNGKYIYFYKRIEGGFSYGKGEKADSMVSSEGTWAGVSVFPSVFLRGVRGKPEKRDGKQHCKRKRTAGVLCADG